MKPYGKELILDIHGCDVSKFNRGAITYYLVILCKKIGMDIEDRHFWDYGDNPEEKEKAPPHLKGTSCVQFIETSNITIHTLDDLKKIFVNIFSCKDFETKTVGRFTAKFFKGNVVNYTVVNRL